MEEKFKSEGKCLFCGNTFAKAGINRHLATHLSEKTANSKAGKSFFVKVETNKKWGTTPYFLSLWIDGEALVEDLDHFLKGIWLECCGHMSAFTDPKKQRDRHGMFDMMDAYELLDQGKTAEYERMMEDNIGQVPMSRKIGKALSKAMVLDYEYDFGSTTALTVTVMDAYPVASDKKIALLSRNEPLKIMCSDCGKLPAVELCTVCMYDEEAVFCEKCAKKHSKKCEEFADYAAMPVVNSPRMGVCGYEGGVIDVERDGIFKVE